MLAYVLLQLKECDEKMVLDMINLHPEVEHAHVLFGEWDILARVAIENPEDLGRYMIENIRSMPEVKLSSTMIVAR